ncbi:hypothetical protein [Nitratireductor soli]|uniref:hypothetical protein n=1 Tax=Nitratireductor soli TaxID=1670619 RepID=UPI00138EE2A9|nr:hypothetical protein [Nitratireductor soli]
MRDRIAAGLMAGLIAYLLIFQGVAAAFAKGAMAGTDAVAGFVICNPSGVVPATGEDDVPAGGSVHDCCTTLCQAGCAVAPAMPAAAAGLYCAFPVVAGPRWPLQALPANPRECWLPAQARAPPSFSI